MSSLLSSYDIQMMKDDIADIIHQWDTSITILIPLPEDKQLNYDENMREFTGPILYCKSIVPARRKDIVNSITNAIPFDDISYGDKNDATFLYSIPEEIPTYEDDVVVSKIKWKPSRGMIYVIDDTDDRYYAISIKERIGETLVTIHRYDGGTPNGCGNIDDIEFMREDTFEDDVPFYIGDDSYD